MNVNLKVDFFLLIILLFGCNFNTDNKNNTKEIGSKYNSKFRDDYLKKEERTLRYLENKNLNSLNDTAKWYLYNTYYDYLLPKSIKRNDTSNKIYLSFLELKPIDCYISNDSLSIDILYAFLYNDSITVQDYPVENSFPIANGVRINLKDKKIITFLLHGGSFKIVSSNNIFEILKQPEIISFIRENKDKLNPSYRSSILKHNIRL